MSPGIGVGVGLPFVHLQRRGGFSPASLFSSGEEGAWYDPSDLSTMFQDADCTVPVTAGDQPVGVIFDKSRGLALGSEILSNPGGPFTTTTGWLSGSGGQLSVSDGKLRITCLDADTIAGGYASLNLTAGALYYMEVEVASVSPSGEIGRIGYVTGVSTNTFEHDMVAVYHGTPNVDSAVPVTTLSGYFIAQGATPLFSVAPWSSTPGFDGVVEITRASVKRVLGNHAYQGTAGSRPLYKTAGGLHWIEGDGVDDVLGFAYGGSLNSNLAVAVALERLGAGAGTGTNQVTGWQDGGNLALGFAHNGTNPVYRAYDPSGMGDQTVASSLTTAKFVGVGSFGTGALGEANGVAITPITQSAVANGGIRINVLGQSGSGNVPRRSNFGMVAINRTLTTAEVSALRTYLAAKSGVTL